VRRRFRAWLRRRLLRWLGYEGVDARLALRILPPQMHGTTGHAAHLIEDTLHLELPLGIALEIQTRNVPEVPIGTLRVVLETYAP